MRLSPFHTVSIGNSFRVLPLTPGPNWYRSPWSHPFE